MILYTCPWQKRRPGWHPCGVAAQALDDAGYSYEIEEVPGQLSMLWTWPSRRRDRTEIRKLSGKNGVPVLVLDDGTVIAGSSTIARWAREQA
jgi:glutathione S-transferase